ncbi:ABC transporter permease [Streptomyces sp. NPDC051664]|uniref:ABC transporter permease n=1 Tax=Streptomyces sp. NPDC051664 TaxID=3365668 RepID=UPI0037A902EE
MRAILRWSLADLKSHRGQALSLALATAGVTAALMLSAALMQYAASPWQQLFTETNGSHIWLRLTGNTDIQQLKQLDGVRSISGPYSTVSLTVSRGTGIIPLELRAVDDRSSGLGEAQLESGRRFGDKDGEVVLEHSTAQALWASQGDKLEIQTGASRPGTLRVTGVAATAEAGYDPGQRPGIAWASATTVAHFQSKERAGQTVALRLNDAADTDFAVQQAITSLGPEHVVRLSTWKEARAKFADENRLVGQLLRVFGVGALLAAAVAVTGGVSSRVHAEAKDISILKVVGMTPIQIVVMFVVQHVGLASMGAATGLLAIWALSLGGAPGPVGDALAFGRILPQAPATVAAVSTMTVVIIAAATALAAWRAAGLPPSPAARPPASAARRMSRTARCALRFGTPPHLVLGWRGATRSRRRLAASVVRLSLPVMLITVALTALTTLDGLSGDQTNELHPTALLTVRNEPRLDSAALIRIGSHPDIQGMFPTAEVTALIPGQTQTVILRGLGTGEQHPFLATEGRAPSAPYEAVAGQGLLDAMRVRVGQWVRLTVGGTPHILHIVGRTIEPEHDGLVITTTLDTLRSGDPSLSIQFYSLVLRPGAHASAVANSLSAAVPGPEIRRTPSPVGDPSLVRGVLAGLIAVIALIAASELASSVSAAVRHHTLELSAFRAMGLTPRQLVGVILTHCVVTATGAALLGILTGYTAAIPLMDLEGRASGVGAGIALRPDASALLLAAGGLILASMAIALVPAVRAERLRTTEHMAGLM